MRRERAVLAVADASAVPGACTPAAVLFSCFSLQQMPQPAAVLAAWAGALAPGGVLAVAYWCASPHGGLRGVAPLSVSASAPSSAVYLESRAGYG